MDHHAPPLDPHPDPAVGSPAVPPSDPGDLEETRAALLGPRYWQRQLSTTAEPMPVGSEMLGNNSDDDDDEVRSPLASPPLPGSRSLSLSRAPTARHVSLRAPHLLQRTSRPPGALSLLRRPAQSPPLLPTWPRRALPLFPLRLPLPLPLDPVLPPVSAQARRHARALAREARLARQLAHLGRGRRLGLARAPPAALPLTP